MGLGSFRLRKKIVDLRLYVDMNRRPSFSEPGPNHIAQALKRGIQILGMHLLQSHGNCDIE